MTFLEPPLLESQAEFHHFSGAFDPEEALVRTTPKELSFIYVGDLGERAFEIQGGACFCSDMM